MMSPKFLIRGSTGFLLAASVVIILSVTAIKADDTFQCCLAGWKTVRGMVICPRPCCEGYTTKHAVLPALGQVTYCNKEAMQPADSSSSFDMIPPNVMAASRGQPRPRRVLPSLIAPVNPSHQNQDRSQSPSTKKSSSCQCSDATS